MNSRPPDDRDPPPPPAPDSREELEARLTAFILGESSGFDAETLHARLAADPELAALHRQLEAASGVFKKALHPQSASTDSLSPAELNPRELKKLLEEAALPGTPTSLNPDRRAAVEKLFAQPVPVPPAAFIAPAIGQAEPEPPLETPARKRRPTIIFFQILAAAACVALLISILLPNVGSVLVNASRYPNSVQSTAAPELLAQAPAQVNAVPTASPAPTPAPTYPAVQSASELVASASASPEATGSSSVDAMNTQGPDRSETAATPTEATAENALVANFSDTSSSPPPSPPPAPLGMQNRIATIEAQSRSTNHANTREQMLNDAETGWERPQTYADAGNTSNPAGMQLSFGVNDQPITASTLDRSAAGNLVLNGGSLQFPAAADNPASQLASTAEGQGTQASLNYESQYIFRGRRVTNNAFQPSTQFGYPIYGGSLNTNVWASQPLGKSTGTTLGFPTDASVNAFPADQVALANRTTLSSGTLTVGGGIVKSDSGTLALGGTNTYAGGTTFSGGIIAGSGSVNKDDSGMVTSTDSGAANASSTPSLYYYHDFVLDGKSAAIAPTPPPTADQRIADLAQEVDTSKSGSSSLTLNTVTGANTYTASTVINGGTLTISSTSSLGSDSTPSGAAADSGNLRLLGNAFPTGTAGAQPSTITQGTVDPNTGRLITNYPSLNGVTVAAGNVQITGGLQTSSDNRLASKSVSNYASQLTPSETTASTNGPDYNMASNSVQALPRTSPIGDGDGRRARAITANPADTAKTSPESDSSTDQPVARPSSPVQFPPSIATAVNPFSTFALNVSDASFRLALAALHRHQWPDPASVRTEEFLNAFNYHDPAPGPNESCVVNDDLAQNPFEAGQNLLRVSFQTAAAGRDRATPLRLTLLLDNSGSMTRSDRVATLQAAIAALGTQLRPGDFVSLVTFARTPQVRLLDIPAERFSEVADTIAHLVPDGGTNLEEALKAAYAVAGSHPGGSFGLNAQNRVVLLTDGAANLGDVDPSALAAIVDQARRAGIALDAYGVGWDGYDDTVLEALTRHSDGRYAFLNRPEDVNDAFAAKLAGALAPAALDVKLQIEFNPARVTSYRLMGYNNLRLTQEQFRDNTVAAGELAAAEQGTALYTFVIDPRGSGPVGTARARFRDPATGQVREWSWSIPYYQTPVAFDQAAPALRLAATAAYFAEYLQQSPFAAEVTPARLLQSLGNASQAFVPDPRPVSLVEALTAAASLAGGN